MPPTIPTAVPQSLVAGDTWQWDITLPDYPSADGWALKYSIRGPSVLADVTATPNAAGVYEVRILATATTNLTPGLYHWAARAEKAPAVHTVASGRFTLVRNLANVVAIETHAAKMVRLIEGALEGRIPADLESFTIAGRTVQHIPVLELRQLLAMYRAEVRRELNPNQLGRRVQVAFGAPT